VLHSQDDGNSCGTPADEYQKLGRLLALGAFLRRLLFVVGWRKGERRTQYAARFAPKLLFCVSVWRQKMRVRALTLYQKSLVERKLCDVEIGFATTL
jgi:hypothetical protein